MADEKNDKTLQENAHGESQFGPNVEDLLDELKDMDKPPKKDDDSDDDKPKE